MIDFIKHSMGVAIGGAVRTTLFNNMWYIIVLQVRLAFDDTIGLTIGETLTYEWRHCWAHSWRYFGRHEGH